MPELTTPYPSTRSRTIRSLETDVTRALFAPIDIAPLAAFRVAFGALMLWEVTRYFQKGWIPHLFMEPVFFFTYPGFDWVRPWPGPGMYIHFYYLGALAALILLGFFYRVAMALFFLGFTYMFLICKSIYLNHFYLLSLISFLMIFIPAHRAFSVDSRILPALRTRWVPAWSLWLLRAQLGIVYIYGGIAKINSDWLRGEPMRLWLAGRADDPLLGPWLTKEWVVYLFSYGGLLLDLFVVPMLLWRRTRIPAVILLLAFHLLNARIWDIGVFPWFMLAATVIFFPPGTLRPLFGRSAEVPPEPTDFGTRRSRRLTMSFIALYLALQLLIPLRHVLYPGNVSWTEEGHYFAWHMKLRGKTGDVVFLVDASTLDEPEFVDPTSTLTPRQKRKMSTRPHMILQFAHHLADRYRAAGHQDVEVRALAIASLNGRPVQRLIDESVNLAEQPRDPWPAPWIIPLGEDERANARLQEEGDASTAAPREWERAQARTTPEAAKANDVPPR